MDLVTLFTAAALATRWADASSLPARPDIVPIADSTPTSPSATSGYQDHAIAQWQPFIAEASNRFGVPEPWVRAVMGAESGGHTTLDGEPITSPVGAMGLMQVMPDTYRDMRQRLGLGVDPFDPHDNILAGTAFLRAMYDRYGYPGFFAAYNAGPQRFDDYLLHGISLPDETLHYLSTIAPGLHQAVEAMRPEAVSPPSDAVRHVTSRSENALFFSLTNTSTTPGKSADATPAAHISKPDFGPSNGSPGGLFVPLSGASHSAQSQP